MRFSIKKSRCIKVILPCAVALFLVLRFSPYSALSEFLKRPVSSRIHDCNGRLVQILALKDGMQRESLDFEQIPDEVKKAFLSAEDSHFYIHPGVDLLSIFRAVRQNTSEGRIVSGASTITMQLARLISPKAKRNLSAKIAEAVNAVRLEARLSKKEILNLYLNNLPFGFNTEGVASAARVFFGKSISSLSLPEIYCLAVIPRRPSLYNPRLSSKNRENCVKAAFSLYQSAYSGKKLSYSIEDFDSVCRNAENFSNPFYAPHLVRWLSGQKDSGFFTKTDVTLSLSLDLQFRAQDLLSNFVEKYSGNRIDNGAVILINTQTAEVLAWAGSADFFDEKSSGQVDGVLAAEQPGSSMKPFLYALALEKGWQLNSILPDIPTDFGYEELYLPQNFNNRWNGPVRFRVALASSLNVPAVYLLNSIGLKTYLEKLEELGFDSLKKDSNGENAGLGLALGNGKVSILELAQAFSVFPRDGLFLPVTAVKVDSGTAKKSGRRIFSEDTARLICNTLSDKDARALGFGYAQTFVTPFDSMFKTGTANQYQNITALAATPLYTVAVWMGNFSGATVVGKTGSSIPAAIARQLLIDAQGKRQAPFEKVSSLYKRVKICPTSGMLAGEECPSTVFEYIPLSLLEKEKSCSWHKNGGVEYPSEYAAWYNLKGRAASLSDEYSPLEITSPRDGSVFFYNAGLVLGRQKLSVEASGGSENSARLILDGKEAGFSDRPFVFYVDVEKGVHKATVICGQESQEILYEVK